MWKRRRNFYFFFIRISIVLDKSSFLPFPQTCVHSVLLGSSRFPMLSVDAVCAFAFSPGSEGLTSDRLELYGVLLSLRSFSFVSSGLTQPEGINPAKDLWKPSPFSLMIVWSLDRWVSKFYTWPCENRSWWLWLRVLWYRLRDSPCLCSLTQSLCLWGSRITTMTPLINKNERDICDRIYPVKVFIIVSDI
jgi:hypothetical protein